MGDDDMPRSLPDDVMQDEVLRRLPPATLAVCRCVCKAWRDAIDSRRMLLWSDLQPFGIFVCVGNAGAAPLLVAAPTSMGRKFATNFPLMGIDDCCNGLLLGYGGHVMDPATRRCMGLPPCPSLEDDDYDVYHLLFEPCVSPHFQVLVFRELYRYRMDAMEDGSAEWPPSPYVMWVYLSETRRWEETHFVREGGPAGTLAEARSAQYILEYNRSVYYHGALYAKSKGPFIMRVTLSDCRYQVIKLPEDVRASLRPDLHLLKSKDGVYAAIIHQTHLRVWLLTESSGRAEWMLKYNINLQAVDAQFSRFPLNEYPIDRPWMRHENVCSNRHAEAEDEFEWDFDKNNILKIEVEDEKYRPGHITLLGFHPYEEVAFLDISDTRVVAYHLDGSKVQDLGQFKNPYFGNRSVPTAYFVYTPCWMSCLQHN